MRKKKEHKPLHSIQSLHEFFLHTLLLYIESTFNSIKKIQPIIQYSGNYKDQQTLLYIMLIIQDVT